MICNVFGVTLNLLYLDLYTECAFHLPTVQIGPSEPGTDLAYRSGEILCAFDV